MKFLPFRQTRKAKILFRLLLPIVLLVVLVGFGSQYYRLSPVDFLQTGARFASVQVLGVLYQDDLEQSESLRNHYWVGFADNKEKSSLVRSIPFVYEELNEDYLQKLRTEFDLENLVASADSEYDAMLRLGAWLGSRWDHGTSRLAGTKQQRNPVEIIRAGEAGKKYWCEIAAIVTVQAATALGWPARLVSLSRDGYAMEHGVAELWSNQYNKWFVLDTDFNVAFESQGVPLSAFELCHRGPDLQKQGLLTINKFAADKPSLKFQDLIPFYSYVQLDLRNDWLSRPLRRGSPAGGDFATWWTARGNLESLLTSALRVDKQDIFDWQVNKTWIKVKPPSDGRMGQIIELAGYSPYYSHFEVRVGNSSWQALPVGTNHYQLPSVVNKVSARLVTLGGHLGPLAQWQAPNKVD